MSLILISSERFAEHQTPPGHPERPERADVMDAVAAGWREAGGEVVAPRAASREQLLARARRRLRSAHFGDAAASPSRWIRTRITSPESCEVARLAAGAAVDAVERVMGGSHQRAIALVRPPGHHAERDRAMGFCLFNNVAVAAAHARALGAATRGDRRLRRPSRQRHRSTSSATTRDVLYVSTHQYPYYPGTGAAEDIGTGAGAGFTVNVPIEAGAIDEDYALVFSSIVVPVLRQFAPELLLVSAGFDAHERDPLAGMRLTTPAFAAMTLELRAVAEECAGGRLALVTEGGYDLHALGASLGGVVQALASPPLPAEWPSAGRDPSRGRAAVEVVRPALAPFWKL